jgi:subtilisin family serine protease
MVETTGALVVTLTPEAVAAPGVLHAELRRVAGLAPPAGSRDFGTAGVDLGAGSVVLDALGVAVVDADPDQRDALLRQGRAGALRGVAAVEPELVMHALATALSAPFADTATATWGLQAIGAVDSPAVGAGARVAVLDTGIDTANQDLGARIAVSTSFVPGRTVHDGNGHGTHCAGTVCGPRQPAHGPRYGVAPEAVLLVAKVLDDTGSGPERQILAGLDWAVTNGAHVVSMSLGADDPKPHVAYDRAGERALAQGTLIVAAAGNNADRGAGQYGFVGVPANSVSVMAVGAVDAAMDVPFFSARSGHGTGGAVDIAAPGAGVRSAWPKAPGWKVLDGTSMATPHVAGAAALWAGSAGAHGRDLWAQVVAHARRLAASASDVGAGCVRAPV